MYEEYDWFAILMNGNSVDRTSIDTGDILCERSDIKYFGIRGSKTGKRFYYDVKDLHYNVV